jgi:5'-phosphate synthase pdxT subunit
MKVGVVSLQGDVHEHIVAMKEALEERGGNYEVCKIRKREEVEGCDAILIPGGESTTIGRLMHTKCIDKEIVKLALDGIPILGTCAGMILLAKHVSDGEVYNLGLMDVWVKRNAWGRQKESFEADIEISSLGKQRAVFIRAPAITKVASHVEVLSSIGNKIVAARQKNLLVLSFHPELTEDRRIHHFFLDMVG